MPNRHRPLVPFLFAMSLLALAANTVVAGENTFQPLDVFQLEYASDPQISPDSKHVVYVRNFMDIMADRRRSNLWMWNASGHRPITSGIRNDSSPRWSADGSKLLYTATSDGSTQLYCRWLDTGQTAQLTTLTNTPSSLAWSPDGKQIAFSMLVPEIVESYIKLPPQPEGARWAPPAKVIRKLIYRFDGKGYLKEGHHQLFVLEADGGTPLQVTTGPYNHEETPAWTPDGKSLIFSSNRDEDWEYEPRNSDIYEVSLQTHSIRQLTQRQGPDKTPVVSPNGEQIAYVGYDDKQQGYQVDQLYLMNRDGSNQRAVTDLSHSISAPRWNRDGQGLFFQYDDRGTTRIGYVTLLGKRFDLAQDMGGTTLGRPYASGSFSVADNGDLTFTMTQPEHPADVALVRSSQRPTLTNGRSKGETPATSHPARPQRITSLNSDLLGHKQLAEVEEIKYDSRFDGREIQGWIVKPPGFESNKKYPLILEIHGGPFANYGRRFSAEIQLYAAAGYVVLYTNPRGSTGYGQEFGNLIHHAYPGNDYDDLMSGIDAVIRRGYIDEDNLFVTGGSGGGVLTAWIVGKTNRFQAAVAAKPVINWYSFALSTDAYPFFYKYWFPGLPWDHSQHYHRRSPLSLVGNVATPTMLLTGENDFRTPMSESEQFYQALKLRRIDTALVRIPDASHAIVKRPSRLLVKVAHILKWFDTHRKQSRKSTTRK